MPRITRLIVSLCQSLARVLFMFCRKIARLVFVVTTLCVGGALLVWGAAQTPEGAHFLDCGLAATVDRLSGGAVTLRGCRIDLAGRVRLGRLSVDGGAAGGVEASGLDVVVDPFSLARGDLHLLRVAAARIALRAGAPATPAADEPASAPALPVLPAWLPGVIVDEFAVLRLELVPATGAAPPAVLLAGSGVVAPGDLSLGLNVLVQTLAGPARRVTATLGHAAHASDATFALTFIEAAPCDAAHALLAGTPARLTRASAAPVRAVRVAGRATAGALETDLHVDVPGADFHGRLTASYGPADRSVVATGRLHAAVPGARTTGPAEVTADFVLSGRQSPGNLINVTARLAAEDATLTTTGTIDLERLRASGRTRITAHALARLARFAGATLDGSLDLTSTWSASPTTATAHVELAGNRIAAPRLLVDARSALDVSVQLANGVPGPLTLTGTGEIATLDVDAKPVFARGHPAHFTLSVARPGDGAGTARLTLEDPDARIEVAAQEVPGGVDAQTHVDGRDLGRRPLLGALAAAATAHLEARVTARATASGPAVTWDGRVSSTGTVTGPMAPALARGVALSGRAVAQADHSWSLEACKVSADRVDVSVTAHVGPADHIDGQMKAKLAAHPELGAGACLVDLEVAGSPAAMRFHAKAAVDHLKPPAAPRPTNGPAPLTEVTLDLAGIASQAGASADLELWAHVHGAAAAASRARLTARVRASPAEVTAEQIVLTLAGARLEGRVAQSASAAFPTARLSGGTTDLAPLLALAGVVARGAADLELALDATGGPRLRADVTARTLEMGPHRIRAAHLTATLTHLTTTPDIQASAQLERVTSADARLDQLTVKAAGTPTHLAITVDTSGSTGVPGAAPTPDGPRAQLAARPGRRKPRGRAAPRTGPSEPLHAFAVVDTAPVGGSDGAEPTGGAGGADANTSPRTPHTFDLHAAAHIARDAPTTRVTLDAVRLHADSVPVALAQPVTLVFAPEHIDVPTLVLTVGTTTLKANLRTDGAQIVAGVLAEHLPLALARPGTSGNASALMKLTGTLAEPHVSLRVLARSVRAAAGTPPLDLDILGALGAGVLESRVSIAGLTERPVVAVARAPVTFALAPFVARLEPDGPLSASVAARAELARLVRVLGLDLARAAGVIALDAKVTGTPASPHVEGLARLTGGHIENPASGTVLTRIAAEVVARGQDITLESLWASDGKDGHLEAHGTARLDGAHLPLDLTVDLKNMRLIHHDQLSVQSGGSLVIRHDRRRLGVTGTLDLGEVLATISRNLPPDAAVVPYELVDAPDAGSAATVSPVDARATRDPKPAAAPALPVDLDIAVKLTRPAKVAGEGLDTEWTGALNVRGQAQRPDVTGTLTLKRGEMSFLGQKLAMNSGSLVFSGGTPPIPQIDIVVQRTASGKTVGVHIEGQATAPRISLTSDPIMPDDEILSQIVFKQDIGSISPVQGLMLAQATLAMARGSLGGGLMNRIGSFSPTALMDRARGALAVDRLDIGTDTLSAGKFVAEGVYVGVEKQPGSADGQVAVEATLKGGFTLQSRMDARSQGSFGLNWSRDY